MFKIILIKPEIKVGLYTCLELQVKGCSLVSFHILSTLTLCLARLKCRIR